MKTIFKTIILTVLLLVVISCSTFALKPTETSVPTETNVPTATFTPQATLPPKNTTAPSTETPSVIGLPNPTGKPLTEWQGIPVMPNEIAGEDSNGLYIFTINATQQDIKLFYEMELVKLGWSLLGSGDSPTGAVLLIFTKGTETFTVATIPTTGGPIQVLFSK